MGFYVTIVLLLGVSVTAVVGNSTGAPTTACSSITPGHGGNTATDSVPYKVNISSLTDGYVPGQSYTIVLSGSSNNTDFLGFLIQGRVMADGSTAAGTFTANSDDQQTVCTGDTGATHTNNNAKTMVELTWNAPPMGTGTILFRYAFVDSFSVYWANQATDAVNEVVTATTTTNAILPNATTSSVAMTTTSSEVVVTTPFTSENATTMSTSTATTDSTSTSSTTDMVPPSDMIAVATTGVSVTPTGVPVTPTVEATPGAAGVMVASSVLILFMTSIITLIN